MYGAGPARHAVRKANAVLGGGLSPSTPRHFCRAAQRRRLQINIAGAAINGNPVDRAALVCVNAHRRHAHDTCNPSADGQEPPEASTAVKTELVHQESLSARYDWNRQWYPVSWVRDLDAATPTSLQLLGKGLVVWRDPAGQWNVFLDVCPHRLVPLSEGRINENGCLECPYHGWAFSADGKCEAIPQGGNPAAPRSAATAYPCCVKQGLLWVWPSPVNLCETSNGPDEADIPILPEAEPGSGWDTKVTFNSFRDLPYGVETLVENLADPGHVPFTHHATISNRENSSIINLKVTRHGPWGFDGRWALPSPMQGITGQMDTEVRYPASVRHTIDEYEARGFAFITATYCVPLAPGRSRVFVRQPFRVKYKLLEQLIKLTPDWVLHIGQNKVLEDDVITLHYQEAALVKQGLKDARIGKVYHMPGGSDAYVAAFRSWLQRRAGGGPFGPQDQIWLQAAGPRQPREALLDRYHSHTKHCKACSGALRNTRRTIAALTIISRALAFAAAVAAAAAVGGGAVAVVQESADSASQGGSLLVQVAGWFLQGVYGVLPDSGTAAGCMLEAALLLLGTSAVAGLQQALRRLEASFITGTWPPPRNTVT